MSTQVPAQDRASLGRRRLRAATITLYGSLLLAGLAIPGAVVDSLREAPRNALTTTLLAVLEPVAGVMEGLRIPSVYRAAKDRFRRLSCGAPDSENPC